MPENNNKISSENNFKYLGIISSVNFEKNHIILADFPKNLPNIDFAFEVKVGFSLNFSQNYSAIGMINHKKYLQIDIKESLKSQTIEFFARKAVFTDFDNLLKKDKELLLPEDILGMKVFDIQTNELIGTIKDVLLNPANQVWIVENDEYELPIPYTPNVVLKVDLNTKTVFIEMIDGLLDLAILKNAPKKERIFKKRGIYAKKLEIDKEK
jgi:16S rRNA processing protein RimM